MNSIKENLALQADEIEALAAIYEENFLPRGENCFELKICSKSQKEIILNVTFSEDYPIKSPPIYQISAPWMSRESKHILNDEIQEVYRNNLGECIIHLWVVTIKDFIENLDEKERQSISEESKIVDVKESCKDVHIESVHLPFIEHGESIIDKKSVFQAHLARITSEIQVPLILRKLKENRKISSATHNSYAYRISLPDGSILEDVEDDGEKKAGNVLLQILQLLNLSDILIIVTRWYGGILLGADRFKDYKKAAQNLINRLELIHNSKNKK